MAMCTPSFAQSAPARPDPHAQLQQILNRPAYRAWTLRQSGDLLPDDLLSPSLSHRLAEALERLFHALADWIQWFFGGRSRPLTAGLHSHGQWLPTVLKLIAWLAILAGAVFILLLVIRALREARREAVAPHILSRAQLQQALEAGDALALNQNQWLTEAQRLADEQNFRAVYRALYLGLLSGLHTLGKIEHARNRTNWTYVRHYRGPDAERTLFADLTDLFDRVWYGRKAVAGTDLQTLRHQVIRLTTPAQGSAAAAPLAGGAR